MEDIREGVSTLEFVCKPEEIGLESESICFIGNVAAKLRLFRQLDKVFVKAELVTSIELECARCLKPVEIILKGAFENQYRPLPKTVKETLDDIGIGYYSEEYIDLQMILERVFFWSCPQRFCVRTVVRDCVPFAGRI